MKHLFTVFLFSVLALVQTAEAANKRVYGLHLFFDEKEFVDVLTLKTNEANRMTGDMHVPDDFDGPLLKVKQQDLNLNFELKVPKNKHRSHDMVFEYSGKFFDKSRKQLIGFVKLKGTNKFIASFVAFERQLTGEQK